jgi:nuclear pore complex protein Nup85
MEDLPPDSKNLEDMIHAALFSGKPASGLSQAAELDPWLAAHLADIMEAISLIDDQIDEA